MTGYSAACCGEVHLLGFFTLPVLSQEIINEAMPQTDEAKPKSKASQAVPDKFIRGQAPDAKEVFKRQDKTKNILATKKHKIHKNFG